MQKGIINQVTTNAKEGKKTWYGVELQDGTKMSSFDAKIAGAGAGDTLEFDVSVNGKYINLNDGWKLTKNASSTHETAHHQPPSDGMTKDDWAAKQKIERDSIERQTAVKFLGELAVAYIGIGVEPTPSVKQAIDKAIIWASSKFDAVKVETSEEAFIKLESTSHIANPGELFTRCKEIGVTREDAFKILGIKAITEVADLDDAWDKIKFAKVKNG